MTAPENIEEIRSSIRPNTGNEFDFPKIRGSYAARELDLCHYCGLKFNVGERIPRIIVGCGHTFCTSCLSFFLRNNRIRCPMCRKVLKGVESVDKLPLNFNILYEVVNNDPLLSSVNFEKCLQADLDLDEDDEDYKRELEPYLCQIHDQRIKHFYCSNCPSIFCRECIKDLHNQEACFVVDLYEIEKMRKLQQQNNNLNSKQLKKRQDGASQSCIIDEPPKKFENPLLKEAAAARALRDQQKAAMYRQVKAGPPTVDFRKEEFGAQGNSQRVQQNFHPKQDQNFDDESYGEDDQSSEPEEGELDSAQKQKLKRDLLMMGYDEDEDFGEEINDQQIKSLVHDPALTALTAMPLEVVPPQPQMPVMQMNAQAFYEQQQQRQQMANMPLEQQLQFEQAMQVQNAMKMQAQQPLRMKQAPYGVEVPMHVEEQELTEAERFALDKKRFAQQLKEELLHGKKPDAKKQQVEQQQYQKLQDYGQEDSYDEQIEIGEAHVEVVGSIPDSEEGVELVRDVEPPVVDSPAKPTVQAEAAEETKDEVKEEVKAESIEAQPLIENGVDSAAVPLGSTSDEQKNKDVSQKPLEEKKGSSNSLENAVANQVQNEEKQMKENTAPVNLPGDGSGSGSGLL